MLAFSSWMYMRVSNARKKQLRWLYIDLDDAYNSVNYEDIVRCMRDYDFDVWLINIRNKHTGDLFIHYEEIVR